VAFLENLNTIEMSQQGQKNWAVHDMVLPISKFDFSQIFLFIFLILKPSRMSIQYLIGKNKQVHSFLIGPN
jgi:hypothetical protein